ncbi:helix-turn-helix domain-containing protein, partial [Micromonospora sp. NPDC003776]
PPPVAIVPGWRLALAADLLRDTGLTLTAVARRVGYGGPFALSAAFKRVHGISPHEYRATD